MPERKILKKAIRRQRGKKHASKSGSARGIDVPDQYQKSLLGEKFALFDSRTDAPDDEDEENDTTRRRKPAVFDKL